MLVLTRKRGEQIRLGDDVVITVLRIKGQAVRIGIEAPQNLRVIREELEPEASPPPDACVAPESAKQSSKERHRVETTGRTGSSISGDRSSPNRNCIPHPLRARPLESRLQNLRCAQAASPRTKGLYVRQ